MGSIFNGVNLPIFLPNPAESCRILRSRIQQPTFQGTAANEGLAFVDPAIPSTSSSHSSAAAMAQQQQQTTTDTIECNTMSNVLTFESRRIPPKLRALNHAESRRITPNRAESRRIAPNRAESRRITPNRAAPNHAESRRITPNRAEAAPKRARSRRIPPVSPLPSLQPHCNTVSDVLGNFGHTEFHVKKG